MSIRRTRETNRASWDKSVSTRQAFLAGLLLEYLTKKALANLNSQSRDHRLSYSHKLAEFIKNFFVQYIDSISDIPLGVLTTFEYNFT